MTRLREEFAAAGKAAEFEHLKLYLTADKGAIDHTSVARELGMTEATLRVAIHRLRRRYREVFREGIAHTVPRPEEIDEEVRHLLAALGQ